MRHVTVLVIVPLVTAATHAAAPATRPAPPGASPQRFEKYVEEIPRYLIKLDFTPVKGGTFAMAPLGGKGESREVEVKDFWMGVTEVPWEAFDPWLDKRWMTEDERMRWANSLSRVRVPPGKSYHDPAGEYGRQRQPVIRMTADSAFAYCQWLSARTGHAYRLPTEAEFEYALRAGGAASKPEDVQRFAWCRENSPTEGFPEGRPHEVATRAADALGLHDLLGNVAELVTPADDARMVARGGSWRTTPRLLTPWVRHPYRDAWQATDAKDPKDRWLLSDGDFIGFRLVRSREEKK